MVKNFDGQWSDVIDAPTPGGIPDPVPQIDTPLEVVRDAIWLALGKPKPNRIIISTQGDWWDTIAIRAYGRKRGNEHLMYRLLEENYPLREMAQFPAGIPVIVPEINVATSIPLVPWTSATFIATP
jgi:phage tail protein X